MFGRRRRPTRPSGQATPTRRAGSGRIGNTLQKAQARRAGSGRSNTMARPARPSRPTPRPTLGSARPSRPARGLTRRSGRRITRGRPTGLTRMTRGLRRRSR